MLLKPGGGLSGIKEYLEKGQKQGRSNSRAELDARVVLAGNLDVTDAIIQRINSTTENYKHFTLSFREDSIDRETLLAITKEFESFVFAAYKKGEYDFYAEAHIPKIKSLINSKNGELVERKPHIHIVIPKLNLLSGHILNPLGMTDHNVSFMDAWQEHINAKYGLASPKDYRRVVFTDESTMMSRHKGDVFDGQGSQLKADILNAMLDRRLERYDDFTAMLLEFGGTSIRNAGKVGEYFNVKAIGAAKGVNLKDYVFSRDFVELPQAEKRKRLTGEPPIRYEAAGAPGSTRQQQIYTIAEWRDVRSKEVKYLNSGNRSVYAQYRAADPATRRSLLAAREAAFYAKFENQQQKEPHGNRKRTRQLNHDYGQHHLGAAAALATAQSLNGVRSLSGLPVVRFACGTKVLLPSDAPGDVEQKGTQSADALRWNGAGAAGGGNVGSLNDSEAGQCARDLEERIRVRADDSLGEFKMIRNNLDARFLLQELAASHGVVPEKYTVTKAIDGGDRIQCGTRNLNVSDFLTKEMNLAWVDAARILRDSLANQLDSTVQQAQREPRQRLWSEFQAHYKSIFTPEQRKVQWQARWDAQRLSERVREAAIRAEFNRVTARILADHSLTAAQRKAGESVARMERIELEAALRETIQIERKQLAQVRQPPMRDLYQSWLLEQARAGDERALAELRRMQLRLLDEEEQVSNANYIASAGAAAQAEAESAVIYRASMLQYYIDHRGNVTYQRHGLDVLRDMGHKVDVLQHDSQNIEVALRLALQKFGNPLRLYGSAEFQEKAARIAADAGLMLEFTDSRLNQLYQERQAEVAALAAPMVVRVQLKLENPVTVDLPKPEIVTVTESVVLEEAKQATSVVVKLEFEAAPAALVEQSGPQEVEAAQRAFKSHALGRECRAYGYKDGSERWLAFPEALRQEIEAYVALPKDDRTEALVRQRERLKLDPQALALLNRMFAQTKAEDKDIGR